MKVSAPYKNNSLYSNIWRIEIKTMWDINQIQGLLYQPKIFKRLRVAGPLLRHVGTKTLVVGRRFVVKNRTKVKTEYLELSIGQYVIDHQPSHTGIRNNWPIVSLFLSRRQMLKLEFYLPLNLFATCISYITQSVPVESCICTIYS